MKQTTRKRIRAMARPLVIVWAAMATAVAFAGALLEALGYLMVGDRRQALQTIKKQF